MTLIYPGSFDPITLGHIDIATRSAKLADTLIVAVLDNHNKTPFLPKEDRIGLLQATLGHIPNIKIDSFSGLLVKYVKQLNTSDTVGIVRGLRNPSDFDSEARYATNNKRLYEGETGLETGLETIFIPANPAYSFISSTIVREIYANITPPEVENTLCNMVPPQVIHLLVSKKNKKNKDKG